MIGMAIEPVFGLALLGMGTISTGLITGRRHIVWAVDDSLAAGFVQGCSNCAGP